ncbi:DUF1963 domain-containing protein [Saccharopolyspora sp. K220]|uniref:DUF1963 domain-containing protein n=1 Tax=Saccharopolyspora soli TaxID=2926618 RepID=UPI001F5AA6BF|nr:DUF1963 domain-containing protein [Saccharopolyspora soli]MCI2416258.1 DUF1963 domain-containing protein [Saccharopolyspora soli]
MANSTSSTRQDVSFVEAAEPITEPVTKLGGQPVWLAEPMWPLSASTGRPMRFIGQIRLPGEEIRLGYLFMTEDDPGEFVDGTSEPTGGENAFFAQPGEPADFYQVASIRRGPTFGPDHHVEMTPYDPDDAGDSLRSRLWGEPDWLQGEQWPDDPGTWQFVAQLDSADEPFGMNFGDEGVAYAFIDEKTGQGRFLWQCG